MLDVATGLVQVCATFGTHIEIVEIDELSHLRQSVTDEQVERPLASIAPSLDEIKPCGGGGQVAD
jgi:L-arabinose isomerase